jgi:hypothetical protein
VQDADDAVRLEFDLGVSEPQREEVRGGVVLIAFVVLRLLGRGAVVGEPVGLDDEPQVREVEVDLMAGDVDRGARERQARPADERQ